MALQAASQATLQAAQLENTFGERVRTGLDTAPCSTVDASGVNWGESITHLERPYLTHAVISGSQLVGSQDPHFCTYHEVINQFPQN